MRGLYVRKNTPAVRAFRWEPQQRGAEWYHAALQTTQLATIQPDGESWQLNIETANGVITVKPGDWLLLTEGGSIVPMSHADFEANYRPLAD